MVKLSRIWSVSLACAALAAVVGAHADIDPRTGQQGGGDVSPQTFADFCGADMRRNDARGSALQDELTATFYRELDRAEGALATGDEPAADDALRKASTAVYRGGTETDLSVKCLGESTARRWFNAKLALWRLQPASRRLENASRDSMRYLMAADRSPDKVVERIKNGPADRFLQSYRAIQEAVGVIEAEREYGAFILREEDQIATTGREALGSLREYAENEAAATLEAEDAAFKRPATEQERQAAQALGGASQLAEAMAGLDIDSADQQEALTTRRQVYDSRELLQTARAYEIKPDDWTPAGKMPTDRRAEQRGDTLLARANDEARSLEVRDDYYNMARRYFEFCRCDGKVAAADAAQDGIQPALRAEEERREEVMEAKRAEFEQKAEATQKAVEDMQKTEAEKQSFKDEADALEAELDF